MCPACVTAAAVTAIGAASTGGLTLFLATRLMNGLRPSQKQGGDMITKTAEELPKVVTSAEWLSARKRLLAKERELTRAYDALNGERRRLPMVRIDKDYVFEGPAGKARLVDLFEGRRQLIIYHFMFDPGWSEGCPSCTALTDEASEGRLRHLHKRDTSMALVSRAPLAKLLAYKERKGWTLPWYSSFGSDFNYDFHVTLDESVAPIQYNYRSREELTKAGWTPPEAGSTEAHGFSCFLREGDEVFHTYSTYGRGGEVAMAAYHLLDLTALGRQEVWEEPKGRVSHRYPPRPDFPTERL
jgi:predicted dithiol-disulfide oxidoreductase (DUF899 family)